MDPIKTITQWASSNISLEKEESFYLQLVITATYSYHGHI
jgi:hypothetical protein